MAIQWRRPAALGRLPALSGSRSGAGGADWFDRWAYRATVTLSADAAARGISMDENVTWCAQWGKLVDLTFRFTALQGTETEMPILTLAHIEGIGITMSGYEQPIWLGYKDNSVASTAGYTMQPLAIVATNGTDWRAGYDLNTTFEDFPVGQMAVWAGNVQLITRTYFKNGVLTYDADDFRTGGV